MGCASCGKGSNGIRCCLCSLFSNKAYPWGAHRKICWRCKEIQERLLKERTERNKKVKKLLAGVGE